MEFWKTSQKEYCKSNRNACCLLELFDLANKRSFMRPRGLLRYEQEICNVISNSIRRFAPNGDQQTGRLTETGLEKLSELGNMIVNNDNVDFQRYFHPIIGWFSLSTWHHWAHYRPYHRPAWPKMGQVNHISIQNGPNWPIIGWFYLWLDITGPITDHVTRRSMLPYDIPDK